MLEFTDIKSTLDSTIHELISSSIWSEFWPELNRNVLIFCIHRFARSNDSSICRGISGHIGTVEQQLPSIKLDPTDTRLQVGAPVSIGAVHASADNCMGNTTPPDTSKTE